jgi:hypothetical protein
MYMFYLEIFEYQEIMREISFFTMDEYRRPLNSLATGASTLRLRGSSNRAEGGPRQIR